MGGSHADCGELIDVMLDCLGIAARVAGHYCMEVGDDDCLVGAHHPEGERDLPCGLLCLHWVSSKQSTCCKRVAIANDGKLFAD